MAHSSRLSEIHQGMVIGNSSYEEDIKLKDIQKKVGIQLARKYNINIKHSSKMLNSQLYDELGLYGNCHNLQSDSSIKPDGGILTITLPNDKNGIILVSENKKQGDGKAQARGNAVERLGKNVTWLQSYMKHEKIMPFVVFCYGHDFCEGSSIIDRVATVANFYKSHRINLYKDEANQGGLSWFYQVNKFDGEQIFNILNEVAEKSLMYYINKYKIKSYFPPVIMQKLMKPNMFSQSY